MPPGPDLHDEAVSPVMGTILMVAITVVVAATLFIVARSITGSDEGASPYVQFIRDSQSGELRIVRVSSEVDLTDVELRSSVAAKYAYNAEADGTSADLATDAWTPLALVEGTLMEPGDFLNFCVPGGADAVRISVRIEAPDAQIYEHRFTGIDDC